MELLIALIVCAGILILGIALGLEHQQFKMIEQIKRDGYTRENNIGERIRGHIEVKRIQPHTWEKQELGK